VRAVCAHDGPVRRKALDARETRVLRSSCVGAIPVAEPCFFLFCFFGGEFISPPGPAPGAQSQSAEACAEGRFHSLRAHWCTRSGPQRGVQTEAGARLQSAFNPIYVTLVRGRKLSDTGLKLRSPLASAAVPFGRCVVRLPFGLSAAESSGRPRQLPSPVPRVKSSGVSPLGRGQPMKVASSTKQFVVTQHYSLVYHVITRPQLTASEGAEGG